MGTRSVDRCTRCRSPGARVHRDNELLCDRCVDRRVAEITGLPLLPEPPQDEAFTGPDGQVHRLHYRLWRAATGIVAEAEDAERAPEEGYHFKVMGPHDADVDHLFESLRTRIRRALARPSLESHPRGEGWIARGGAVEGRLEWTDSGLPYDVVVDGRRLSWEEFGRVLEPFEGWQFRLHFVDLPMIDSADDEQEEIGAVIPLAGRSEIGRDEMGPTEHREKEGWELDRDDEEFLAAWDRAEAAAVDLLREALPEVTRASPPGAALREAAERLRSGMGSRSWPYEHICRAAGWRPGKLPGDDLELWLGSARGLISAREETGLGSEEESTIMALELADWLGAVVGLVRAGVGASAEPEALVGYIDACPEVDGTVDPDEASLVETAFELVLPAWEAAGAVDEYRRLTRLGWWGLPRALAWAWSGELDRS